MNNDSTPIPTAALPSTTAENTTSVAVDSREPVAPTENVRTPPQRRFFAQISKKLEFIEGLMKNLDMLIYAELSILYYMDCSLFRMIIRALTQFAFLTPKPTFLPPLTVNRPYIHMIFTSNIICILLHIFTARSEAEEAMHGYLHGGIIIDIIGQRGPTSKIHLLLLDLLVFGLQCFMLAVLGETERLAAVMKAYTSPRNTAQEASENNETTFALSQDHDAEERGVMREGVAGNGDIELQTMSQPRDDPLVAQVPNEMDDDRARLLAEPSPREERGDGLDTFWSGRAIVADLYVIDSLRRQWNHGSATGSATGDTLQRIGFSAGVANTAAGRRLRFNAVTQRLQDGADSLTR